MRFFPGSPCSRRGSIALFGCVIITSLVLVMGVWLQAAALRSFEASLCQGMTAQIQVSLAGYDRQLYEHFGLLGFTDGSPDLSVIRGSLTRPMPGLTAEAGGLDSLFDDPAVFERQVVRHMKTRLPALWLELFMDGIGQFRQQVPSLLPAAGRALQPADQARAQSVLRPDTSVAWTDSNSKPVTGLSDILRQALKGLASGLVRRAADILLDHVLEEMTGDLEDGWQEELADIRSQYRQYAAETVGVRQSGSLDAVLGRLPDFLDPGSLTVMAEWFDRVLSFPAIPVYEKLCLTEYTLAYLVPRTAWQYDEYGRTDLLTPDGRSLAALSADRPSEVEQVITGLSSHQSAALAVRFLLVSLRALIHLAAILTDENRMASLRGTAATLSGTVAVLSGGTAVIEPEAVTYILASALAIGEGYRDARHLVEGHGVRFWPGRGNLTFRLWYGDYNRLLLLFLPRSVLLDRVSRQIRRIHPGPCYTRLTVQVSSQGRTWQLSGGYDG